MGKLRRGNGVRARDCPPSCAEQVHAAALTHSSLGAPRLAEAGCVAQACWHSRWQGDANVAVGSEDRNLP
eukprot:8104174-Pyramimonas_sp.AAC.1